MIDYYVIQKASLNEAIFPFKMSRAYAYSELILSLAYMSQYAFQDKMSLISWGTKDQGSKYANPCTCSWIFYECKINVTHSSMVYMKQQYNRIDRLA